MIPLKIFKVVYWIRLKNRFQCTLKLSFFLILRQQYWAFHYCFPYTYLSSKFAKDVTLNLFAFFYEFCTLVYDFSLLIFLYSLRSCNYFNSNSCHPFALLKAIVKSKGKLINSCCSLSLLKAISKSKGKYYAITGKSKKQQQQVKRAITLYGAIQKRRTAKRFRATNFAIVKIA